MHTYRDSADLNSEIKRGTEWTVGYYWRSPDVNVLGDTIHGGDEFMSLSRHKTEDGAMRRVNYLNGGTGSTMPGR
jgi:hypothetical protein